MAFINYQEFYQKSLLPIGHQDYDTIMNNQFEKGFHPSHWLIALEGKLIEGTEKYHWRVMVFPANKEGTFLWQNPFFISSYFNCINDAIQYAKTIENICLKDSLTTYQTQEKIG